MAKITANQRQTAIGNDQTKIQKEWAAVSSTINRLTLELKEYASWKNDSFLTNKDFDLEDVQKLNAQFLVIFAELQANITTLAEVGAIPSDDLTVYKTNNDKYIVDNAINVIEFDKRYQV